MDATAGLDAGEYTLVLKPEAAAAYPNYAIQYTPVKFSIAKRAVEIVIEKKYSCKLWFHRRSPENKTGQCL